MISQENFYPGDSFDVAGFSEREREISSEEESDRYGFNSPDRKLGAARDIFLFGQRDLEDCLVGLTKIYSKWVNEETHCSARYFDHQEMENKWKFWEAPKRGNEIYVHDVKKRLRGRLPSTKQLRKQGLLADKNETNTLHITLTVDPKRFLGKLKSAWENISYHLNKFLSAFRTRYGKTFVLRSFEAQRNGFVHIHLFMITEHTFECKWHNRKNNSRWIIPAKKSYHIASDLKTNEEVEGFENLWNLGFVNARGIGSDPNSREKIDISDYVIKDVVSDITNSPDLSNDELEKLGQKKFYEVSGASQKKWNKLLSLSLNWLFRKQAFSISGKKVLEDVFDLTVQCLTQTEVLESGILKRVFLFARYEFREFLGIIKFGKDPPDGFVKLNGHEIDELEANAVGVRSGVSQEGESSMMEDSGVDPSDHYCESCKEDFDIEVPAKRKVRMSGREVWLCNNCLQAAGGSDG